MHFFYFKSFLRFLGRNRLYTTINVFGFSVSLMFVILIGALYSTGIVGRPVSRQKGQDVLYSGYGSLPDWK